MYSSWLAAALAFTAFHSPSWHARHPSPVQADVEAPTLVSSKCRHPRLWIRQSFALFNTPDRLIIKAEQSKVWGPCRRTELLGARIGNAPGHALDGRQPALPPDLVSWPHRGPGAGAGRRSRGLWGPTAPAGGSCASSLTNCLPSSSQVGALWGMQPFSSGQRRWHLQGMGQQQAWQNSYLSASCLQCGS